MFSRLWQWALPRTARTREAAKSLPLVSARAPETAASARPAGASSPGDLDALDVQLDEDDPARFFDELARELSQGAPLSDEDEAQVVALVLQVVDYVTRKKVEPPVMPALVPRVLAITGEPEVDVGRLTQVIDQDLALSAKLLSVANSPAFGGNIELKTVRKAIAYLGTEQVAQVAIGLACASSFDAQSDTPPLLRARWSRLFQHGMTCAFTASYLASKLGRAAQEQTFLGGLFHDVGKAVALRAIEALHKRGALELPSELVLDEALQRIHAYPGDEFYAKWTLPQALMGICAQHHQLEDVSEPQPELFCVSLASAFDSFLRGGPVERRDALDEARVSGERLGLSEEELRAAYDQARQLGEKSVRMVG